MATLAVVLDTRKPRAISTDGSRDKCDWRNAEQRTMEPQWLYVECNSASRRERGIATHAPKNEEYGFGAGACGIDRRLWTFVESLEGAGSQHHKRKNRSDARCKGRQSGSCHRDAA